MPMALCPQCGRAIYRLHWREEQWRCRLCAGPLVYECRSGGQAVPKRTRARWLRKRLEAAPARHSRPLRLRLLVEIAKLEGQLVDHVRHDVCDVLERREARRRKRGKHTCHEAPGELPAGNS